MGGKIFKGMDLGSMKAYVWNPPICKIFNRTGSGRVSGAYVEYVTLLHRLAVSEAGTGGAGAVSYSIWWAGKVSAFCVR